MASALQRRRAVRAVRRLGRYALAVAGAVVACATIAAGGENRAQSRFTAVSRDSVAGAPGLQIVTLRDTVANACYTVFILEASPSLGRSGSPSVEAAADDRDRQLAALIADLDRALVNAAPGTLGPNLLRYQWEGDKVQSDYERQLREAEFGRLEAQLAAIASAPRLAVTGPSACAPAPSSTSRNER